MFQTINSFRKSLAALIAPELPAANRIEREKRRIAERLANRDELTGLANRRAFELARVKAEASTALSFVVFDLDNFKAVNDTLGHSAGDTVLKEFARALKTQAAAIGCAERTFRLGGDEFGAIVPNGLAQEFRNRAEKAFGSREVGAVTVSASGAIGSSFEMADGWLAARKEQRKAGKSYR